MALDIDSWPDLLDLRDGLLDEALFELDDDAAFAPDADAGAAGDGAVNDGFLEFEDDPMALEDRPGGLVLDPAGAAGGAAVRAAGAAPGPAKGARAAKAAPVKRKRRPRIRPAEKSLEEMAANARRFHAWQRGERQVPAQWGVTDQWVWVR